MPELLSEMTGTLIVTRCWCGVQHAVPESLYNLQKRQRDNNEPMQAIFCPLGHEWCLNRSDSALDRERKLREQREQALIAERARHDQTRAELRETESRRRAEKAAKTKLKKRAAAGVCPCCTRSFQDLARHMTGQHPEFVAEAKGEQA